MKLLFYVLNQKDKLDDLVVRLSEVGVSGATIIPSRGMAKMLYSQDESSFMTSLRALMDQSSDENCTIFTVVNDEQVAAFRSAVHDVVGDLSQPGGGILFTLPIDSVEGLK